MLIAAAIVQSGLITADHLQRWPGRVQLLSALASADNTKLDAGSHSMGRDKTEKGRKEEKITGTLNTVSKEPNRPGTHRDDLTSSVLG